MQYNILSTGSKGNAVLLENSILVDCGVPFKTIKPYMRDLQIVLLTHQHSDHFWPPTVKRLAAERPTLRFGCGEWMVPLLVEAGVAKKNIDVYEFDKAKIYVAPHLVPGVYVEMFPLFHDVQNAGWKITLHYPCVSEIFPFEVSYKAAHILYATDTSKILTEAKDYDLYLVEANYEDEEVQERIEKQIIEGAEYIHEYKAMRNHLSQKAAYDFICANMGPKSEYVLLHGHEDKEDKYV